jgi:hypothetical protein
MAMAASFLPKGGSAVERTQVGKSGKVMTVVEGNELPIGLYVASAQPHEVRLAQATFETIRVPRPRGRPRTRPNEVVADQAHYNQEFRGYLRRRGHPAHDSPI